MYDCIVVGAGPAGGSAAYHLAKRGRSVLVIEKDALPRYKPCGGGVSPAVAEWFDFDFAPVISLKVDTFAYTWNGSDAVEAEFNTDEPLWMVRRELFDHFLVSQAQGQGARLRAGTAVEGISFERGAWQVATANGTEEARFLIAADGAKGPMARWLGFEPRQRFIGGALEIEAPADLRGRSVAHFEFGLLKTGYLWNFPKADGHSIGIGTLRAGRSQNLRQLVGEYTPQFGVDAATARQVGHPLCLWNGDQKLHTQCALLAGEAACLVDPFTAEGIRPSMYSGVMAALAVHEALSGDVDALEGYSRTMMDEWGADMLWAQRLSDAFYRFPWLAYQVGIKRPNTTCRMFQIMTGKLRYADVAERTLSRLSGGLVRAG